MSKVTAPLLSFGASGQIGGTLVHASWRGIPYVRRYVTPANPQSTDQTKTRSTFSFLSSMWKAAPALLTAPWDAYAVGQPLLGRNAFIGQNVKALRAGADMTAFIGSPGAKGGIPPTSVAVTPGAGQLAIAFTNPAAPTGWTIASAIAACVPNTDPHTATLFATVADEDAVTQDAVTLTGLSAQEYVVVAWLKWSKPDGSTAYSASIETTGTAT